MAEVTWEHVRMCVSVWLMVGGEARCTCSKLVQLGLEYEEFCGPNGEQAFSSALELES